VYTLRQRTSAAVEILRRASASMTRSAATLSSNACNWIRFRRSAQAPRLAATRSLRLMQCNTISRR